MEKYVITIARQFGSLGRPIAKRMSEILNIMYYDRDIVEKTAEKMDMTIKEISNQEEKAESSIFKKMGTPLGMGTTEMQDRIFCAQKSVISEITERESCIIVGRCSDAILSGYKNVIHIYIYAPYIQRLKNCVDVLHMEEKEARRMIAEVDKARKLYHKTYARFSPEDIEHKDILVNSALLGVEGTAELLCEIIRKKYK